MPWEKTVSYNADTDEVVALINKTMLDYSKSPFVVNLAKELTGGKPVSLSNYIRSIFNYACRNVQYERDPVGWEKIFTPERLIQEGKGDCKKFTVLLGSLLLAAGLDAKAIVPKVVSYDGANWEHIYITVQLPGKIYAVIDPVNDCKLNREVWYEKAKLYHLNGKTEIMPGNKLSQMGNKPFDLTGMLQGVHSAASGFENNLNVLTGVGCPSWSDQDFKTLSGIEQVGEEILSLNGIGKKKKKTKEQKKAKREKIFKKVVSKIKGGAAAPMRASAILLIEAGSLTEKTPLKFNVAKKLAKNWQRDGGKKLSAIWEKFGGKRENLRKAIIKGSKVQLAGAVQLGSLAALITAATASLPIFISFVSHLKGTGDLTPQETIDADNTVDALEDQYDDETGDSRLQPPPNAFPKVGQQKPGGNYNPGGTGPKVGQDKPGGEYQREDDGGSENADAEHENSNTPPPPPVAGSLFSPLGIIFKCCVIPYFMQSDNIIFQFIVSLIFCYGVIGWAVLPFYYGMFGMKKRLAWYFEAPAKALYSLNPFKKRKKHES